jgi:hypothetical protein
MKELIQFGVQVFLFFGFAFGGLTAFLNHLKSRPEISIPARKFMIIAYTIILTSAVLTFFTAILIFKILIPIYIK